jgi:Type II restriction endonuclease EcoO109I
MRHPGLPQPRPLVLSKRDLLGSLQRIDASDAARTRVLAMETDFQARIDAHVSGLPAKDSTLQKLSTSPYVLLIYARQHLYERISEIESDIIPAKVFSSMETSAGRMIEAVALPAYGWECVASPMHSTNSALDGRRYGEDAIEVATLKSGPRCLNDEMVENFADAILAYARPWAEEGGVDHVKFTYGVLYGTQKQSNKKDWHILRALSDKIAAHGGKMTLLPWKRWDCSFTLGNDLYVDVAIRVGGDWWSYLGGDDCALEVWTALIRACVRAGVPDPRNHTYAIGDLADIVSTECVPAGFNVSLLQKSQFPWLFFVARHFCDRLDD